MQKIPLFGAKADCCGCSACENVCVAGAITMQADTLGAHYPVIDAGKCLSCGRCLKVCPLQAAEQPAHPALAAYAAQAVDGGMLNRSASGGVFTVLAMAVLRAGGIVYGCAMETVDGLPHPKHIRVDDAAALERLQGSKYAQSDIGLVYQMVAEDLSRGREVLFSGTPCQVAALRCVVGDRFVHALHTVDIICHGTPGGALFKDYLQTLGHQLGGHVIAFYFRDKSQGWGLSAKAVYVNNRGNPHHRIISVAQSSYYQLFLHAVTYRNSCYTCRYACSDRMGDITLGDYWGIEQEHPECLTTYGGAIEASRGISCILVNTPNGQKMLGRTTESLWLQPSSFSKIANANHQLLAPSPMGIDRETVERLYLQGGYAAVEHWYQKQLGLRRYGYALLRRLPDGLRVWLAKQKRHR